MHDGSRLRLHKLEEDYDPTNKIGAITRLMEAHEKDEVLTGVFYVNPKAPNFIDMLNMTDEPLAHSAGERYSPVAQGAGRVHGRAAVGSSMSKRRRPPSGGRFALETLLISAMLACRSAMG